MKRLLLAAIAATTIFSSCQKRIDFEVPCRIVKIIEKVIPPNNWPVYGDQLTFSYNQHGDPVSLIYNETSTGKPNFFFVYDNKRRLVRQYGKYDNQLYEFFTKYYYDNKNMISFDTTFALPNYNNSDTINPYVSFLNKTVNKYHYDSKGRIIQIDHQVGGTTTPPTIFYSDYYSYDSKGNLISNIPYVYDNKVNFLRTNIIFCFIERNYSANNPIAAISYNFKKLPTEFALQSPSFFRWATNVHEIIYDCSNQQGHY